MHWPAIFPFNSCRLLQLRCDRWINSPVKVCSGTELPNEATRVCKPFFPLGGKKPHPLRKKKTAKLWIKISSNLKPWTCYKYFNRNDRRCKTNVTEYRKCTSVRLFNDKHSFRITNHRTNNINFMSLNRKCCVSLQEVCWRVILAMILLTAFWKVFTSRLQSSSSLTVQSALDLQAQNPNFHLINLFVRNHPRYLSCK
jgi:hypothetical protein